MFALRGLNGNRSAKVGERKHSMRFNGRSVTTTVLRSYDKSRKKKRTSRLDSVSIQCRNYSSSLMHSRSVSVTAEHMLLTHANRTHEIAGRALSLSTYLCCASIVIAFLATDLWRAPFGKWKHAKNSNSITKIAQTKARELSSINVHGFTLNSCVSHSQRESMTVEWNFESNKLVKYLKGSFCTLSRFSFYAVLLFSCFKTRI